MTNDTRNQEYISRLLNTREIGNVFAIIQEADSSWMVNTADNFSLDYNIFEKNWLHVCNITNTSPAKIILVTKIETLLERTFAEILTRSGFCVRETHNFTLCKKCNSAIPTREMYDVLKRYHTTVIPRLWSERCSTCND